MGGLGWVGVVTRFSITRQWVNKPYKRSVGNIKVELDLSKYATKVAEKLHLAGLKAQVH